MTVIFFFRVTRGGVTVSSMSTVFTPEHSPLDKLFSDQTTYLIPPYQRPYSWQCLGKTDRNNQVNQMWDDLWRFFRSSQDREYFLGSIVVIDKSNRAFEVIDGQQRLTTLSLLVAAMRKFILMQQATDESLKAFRDRALQKLERFLFNEEEGITLVPKPKVKVQREIGPDFDAALMAVLQGGDSLPEGDEKYGEIASRYRENFLYFLKQFQACFLRDGSFGHEEATLLNKYFQFLFQRVAVVKITTADFNTAYSIFEILNNRGLPLSGRDLLRNFVIKKLAESAEPDPSAIWVSLERDFVLHEDFIGRFVESRTATQLQKSAFNEFEELYETTDRFTTTATRSKISHLVEEIRSDLEKFSFIVEPERISDHNVRNRVALMRELGNARYSTNLLLALFRCLKYKGGVDREVVDFLRVYEAYMLYLLFAPGARFSNAPIYKAIREINQGRYDAARRMFELDEKQKKELRTWIDEPIRDLIFAKLLLFCVICRESTPVEDDLVSQQFDFASASLEHIIPQNPQAKSNWLRDFDSAFRNKYTDKLGNMTLLTVKLNSSARNFDFSKKRERYKRTNLGMTRELAGVEVISKEMLEKRHKRFVKTLTEELILD